MRRVLLTALNTLSAAPILIWPFLFFGSDSLSGVLSLIYFIVLISYPFVTFSLISRSRKNNSLLLATYAFIPMLAFFCVILIDKYYP